VIGGSGDSRVIVTVWFCFAGKSKWISSAPGGVLTSEMASPGAELVAKVAIQWVAEEVAVIAGAVHLEDFRARTLGQPTRTPIRLEPARAGPAI
jgi:hypothetical protein